MLDRTEKRCPKCTKTLPVDRFHRGGCGGYGSYCIDCTRSYHRDTYLADVQKHKNLVAAYRKKNPDKIKEWGLQRKYGISLDTYNRMFLSQGGRCAICRTDVPAKKYGWHVDHDHSTEKVRGILCNKCNRGLGYLNDSLDILKAAIKYIESSI